MLRAWPLFLSCPHRLKPCPAHLATFSLQNTSVLCNGLAPPVPSAKLEAAANTGSLVLPQRRFTLCADSTHTISQQSLPLTIGETAWPMKEANGSGVSQVAASQTTWPWSVEYVPCIARTTRSILSCHGRRAFASSVCSPEFPLSSVYPSGSMIPSNRE